jgi:hypothetical protein
MGQLRLVVPSTFGSLILLEAGEAPGGLTQASQHDPNGTEVGESTEGKGREDFCSDLEIQMTDEERVPGLHCFLGDLDLGDSAAPSL